MNGENTLIYKIQYDLLCFVIKKAAIKVSLKEMICFRYEIAHVITFLSAVLYIQLDKNIVSNIA